MSEREEYEKREEQRDLFTFGVAMFFFCIISVLAHGFFGYVAMKRGGVHVAFPYVAVYVFPGLLCGFVWRKWGVLIGAIMGVVVSLLSIINMGYLVPLKAGTPMYSSDMAAKALPGAFVLVFVVAPAVTGALAAAVGYIVAEARYGGRRLFRWLCRIGLVLLTLGFIVAGGVLLYSILPFGKLRGVQVLAARIDKVSGFLATPVAVVMLLGAALIVLCVLVGARELPRIIEAERARAPKDRG